MVWLTVVVCYQMHQSSRTVLTNEKCPKAYSIYSTEYSEDFTCHSTVYTNSHLLFCIATLSDQLETHVQLSQPIGSKTKTNSDLLMHIFSYFAPATFAWSFDWRTGLCVFFVFGQCDYYENHWTAKQAWIFISLPHLLLSVNSNHRLVAYN